MNATGPSGELGRGKPMIRLEGVGKRYADGTVAVHELDLEVLPGEVVVLVGPSGCGKSTTLKMINRLIEPTSGRIFLEGRDVTAEDPVQLRRRIGYVIQQIGLFPHQKISTNVATVPSLIGTPKAQAQERARELLALVGPRPRRVRRPLPPPALRRSAAAGRGRPRARRGPAGAAHGRAVRGRRPGGPGAAPGRVPASPGRARQDRGPGDPRHRRGGEDGRPGRGAGRGRPARAVRDARGDPRPPGRRLRGRLRRLHRGAAPADGHQARPRPPRAAGRRRHR